MIFNLKDKRKKYTIIFDTETTPFYSDCEPKRKTNFKSREEIYNAVPNSIEEYQYKGETRYSALISKKCEQVIFDFGYTVASIDGSVIYKKVNYLVDEVFTDMNMMKQAFYYEKFPDYLRMLSDGKIKLKNWIHIKQELERDLVDFRIYDIWAYNVAFDSNVLDTTNRMILSTPFELFVTYDINVNCLWGWACETILQSKRFIKQAIKEGWLSDKGNIKTSAEVCYRYLTQNFDFIEDHTALSDSIIETEIYRRLKKTNKKYSGGIISQPWALVKGRAQALGLLQC